MFTLHTLLIYNYFSNLTGRAKQIEEATKADERESEKMKEPGAGTFSPNAKYKIATSICFKIFQLIHIKTS